MTRFAVVAGIAFLQACGGGAAPADTTPSKPQPAPAPAATGHEHRHGHHHQAHGHHARRGPMVHSFKGAEKWALRFDAPGRDKWQKPAEVVKLLDISPGMVVADIGAGTGYFLPHLSRAVGDSGKVWGLDVEPDMVRYIKARAKKHKLDNVNARVVAPDDPKLRPGSVDRILIVDTWHHIAKRVDYARKLAAALRPGGKLVVVDFTLDTKRGPPKRHRLKAETIMSELRGAGFKPTLAHETLPDQYVIVATR